jgi:hypothetical protein
VRENRFWIILRWENTWFCLYPMVYLSVTQATQRRFVNNELERMWKEAVVANLQYLPEHFPGVTEENHKKPYLEYSVSLSRFEPGTPRNQSDALLLKQISSVITAKLFYGSTAVMPISVATRSKAWTVFARSNTGIVGSNLTRGMNVCVRLFCVYAVLYVGSGLATGWSPVQGVLPTVYGLKNWNSGQDSQGL